MKLALLGIVALIHSFISYASEGYLLNIKRIEVYEAPGIFGQATNEELSISFFKSESDGQKITVSLGEHKIGKGSIIDISQSVFLPNEAINFSSTCPTCSIQGSVFTNVYIGLRASDVSVPLVIKKEDQELYFGIKGKNNYGKIIFTLSSVLSKDGSTCVSQAEYSLLEISKFKLTQSPKVATGAWAVFHKEPDAKEYEIEIQDEAGKAVYTLNFLNSNLAQTDSNASEVLFNALVVGLDPKQTFKIALFLHYTRTGFNALGDSYTVERKEPLFFSNFIKLEFVDGSGTQPNFLKNYANRVAYNVRKLKICN